MNVFEWFEKIHKEAKTILYDENTEIELIFHPAYGFIVHNYHHSSAPYFIGVYEDRIAAEMSFERLVEEYASE